MSALERIEQIKTRLRELIVLTKNSVSTGDTELAIKYLDEHESLSLELIEITDQFEQAMANKGEESEDSMLYQEWYANRIKGNHGALTRISKQRGRQPPSVKKLLSVNEETKLKSLREILILSGGDVNRIIDLFDESEREQILEEMRKYQSGELTF